ncbi:MAG TPA: RHS repeat-associated core domain-containing protein, partial [Steroidobacteraceae bacterium]|nr:RHS repeat-associated core domain-containing protein [Steroidobacteraceae bacterium]
MRTPAGRFEFAARAHPAATALVSAALTFGAAFGQVSVAADPTAGASPALDAPYAYDATTGTAVTLAAGRTPGQFGVTNSGAATYRIPLWTPPGVGDAELELALVYNSRAGNGALGHGWSLEGLSAISRCNRTVAQDGVAGGVTLTFADRFCLDGQQLKLVSGSHGAPGAVYATEIESFSRIVANGVAGNGPLSFTVTTKNGLVYEYGGTSDSRIQAGATETVRTWALSRLRDRARGTQGNAVLYAYQNDAAAGAYGNGSYRIASISYPVTAAGAGPFYQVTFQYSARPVVDVPTGYLAGAAIREPNQLDAIVVQETGSASAIKTYNLGYATAPVTGRLRLTSVQECAPASCLRPTTITYQNGTAGWQATQEVGVAASASKPPMPLDLNGDGLTDLLYPVDVGGGNLGWRILLATLTGYAAPFDTGLTTGTSTIIPGEFIGNGRTQFLLQQSGTWYIAGYGSNGFTATSTGLATGGEYAAADLDGDGLADLISKSPSFTPTISVRRNMTVPNGAVAAQFAPSKQDVWTVPTNRQSMPWDNLRVADMNGDGRADIVVLTFIESERRPRFFATPLLSNGFGNAFTINAETELAQTSMVAMGDWNADGCSDIVQLQTVYVSDCAGRFVEVPTRPGPATGSELYTVVAADWNGDGRTDLLYVDASSKRWMAIPSTGSGAGAIVATGIDAPDASAWFVHDANGDGLVDLGYRDGNNGNKLRSRLHAGPSAAPDLATSFEDGFGMHQRPTYVSLARANHTPRSDAVFPEVDFRGPLYLVSEFTATDGTGGMYQNRLQYVGARRHLQGRGFEGFEYQRIEDTRTGLLTYDYVARAFPFTGLALQRTIRAGDGSTVISSRSTTPSRTVLGDSASEQRAFVHVTTVQELQYEHGGALNGSLTRQAVTTYAYEDGNGNPTRVETSIVDKDPSSPFTGSEWKNSAVYTYRNDTSDNWCLGLPLTSATTWTAPGQAAVTRNVKYTVDSQACRLTQQVLQPYTPALKLATNYGYDDCGNLNSLSVVGALPDGTAMPARTTTFSYGSRCQLPETVTNALGQARTFGYRYDFGVPTRATDPNGLSTTWIHDEFGRRTRETRPDQTATAWAYESCGNGPCSGDSDLRFVVYESEIESSGRAYRMGERHYDGFERLRHVTYERTLGALAYVKYTYDAAGRQVSEHRPYSAGSNGWTSRSFDAVGRLTAQRVHNGAGAVLSTHLVGYSGRTTTVTDPLGRTRSVVHDVTGRLRRVVDPSPGGTTRYDYDSTGNLVRLQDPIGAVSTGQYNARGFRKRWTDVDAGTWMYVGNSFNELTEWTDANGRTFSATYDALGRLVSRTEPEGVSAWTWGNDAGARNIGRLKSVVGLGYGEEYFYDELGRLSAREIVSDQTYRYDYTYNKYGKLDTLQYPASPVPPGQSGDRFKLQFSYSRGNLFHIDDATGGLRRVLWMYGADNEELVPIAESFANATISRTSTFDPSTGRLLATQVGNGGNPSNLQNLTYQWDAAGNLTQRRDVNQNLTESFGIDALDRVTSASLNGVANLSVAYDASGNVTSKSDVGAYTYGHPTKLHAVTAAGTEKFVYDANGNVVTRNNLAQEWASFNLPTLLRKAGQQSQFSYGPYHQRWRQVATYQNGTETTHYVGGLLEKVETTSTGVTYWRHYVPTPGGSTVVVSRNSDGSAPTRYLLPDHLGSTDTVLAFNGSLVARMSYDAFGMRRGNNWSASTAPQWNAIANTSRQGYTGHDMLDNTGLVHMGGRVYDPKVGRFASADPIIGDLQDSQFVNPFAYVGNRPLRDIDPSGLDPAGGGSFAIAVAIMRTAANFLGVGQPILPPATAIPGQSAQNGVGICGPGTFSPTCGGN